MSDDVKGPLLLVQEAGSGIALASTAPMEGSLEATSVAAALQKNEAALQEARMEASKLRQLLDGAPHIYCFPTTPLKERAKAVVALGCMPLLFGFAHQCTQARSLFRSLLPAGFVHCWPGKASVMMQSQLCSIHKPLSEWMVQCGSIHAPRDAGPAWVPAETSCRVEQLTVEKGSLEGRLQAATLAANDARREHELLIVQLEEVTDSKGEEGFPAVISMNE